MQRRGRTQLTCLLGENNVRSDKVKIYVAEHTDPWLLRDVDDMITRVHPGGRVSYWSIH